MGRVASDEAAVLRPSGAPGPQHGHEEAFLAGAGGCSVAAPRGGAEGPAWGSGPVPGVSGPGEQRPGPGPGLLQGGPLWLPAQGVAPHQPGPCGAEQSPGEGSRGPRARHRSHPHISLQRRKSRWTLGSSGVCSRAEAGASSPGAGTGTGRAPQPSDPTARGPWGLAWGRLVQWPALWPP